MAEFSQIPLNDNQNINSLNDNQQVKQVECEQNSAGPSALIMEGSTDNWVYSLTYNEIYDDIVKLGDCGFDCYACRVLCQNMDNRDETLTLVSIQCMTSIPKLLSKYEWLKVLKISDVKIEKIDNLPKNIFLLSITNSSLRSVSKGDIPDSVGKLILSENNITEIDFETLPINLSALNLANNGLATIRNGNYLTKLKILQLSQNILSTLPELPKSLDKLDISRNRLSSIDGIPDNVTELDFSNNKVPSLINIPNKLTKLIGYNNDIRHIMVLPPSLKTIDVSYNEISYIGTLPKGLVELDLSHNNLTYLSTSDIPDSLEELDISGNKDLSPAKLQEIHEKLKHVKVISDYDDDDIKFNLFDSPNYEDQWGKCHGNGYRLGGDSAPWYQIYNNYWNQYNNSHGYYGNTWQNQGYDIAPKSKHNKSNPYYIIHKKTVKV